MRIAASNPGPLLGPDAGIELPASPLDGIHAGGGTPVLSGEPRTGKSRLPAVAAGAVRPAVKRARPSPRATIRGMT
jgi:hypothetical protein